MFMVMMGNTFFQVAEDSVMATNRQSLHQHLCNKAYTTIIAQGGSLGDVWLQLAILAGVAVIGFL